MSDANVRRKRMIDELFAGRHVSGLCPRPLTAAAEGDDWGTGGSRQSGCAVAMVAVGMGDDNVGDRASSGGGENGGAMGFILWARIDDGEPCRANEIGVGAAKCERAGIGCHDAHDTWRHGLGVAVAERHRRFEGDLSQGRPRLAARTAQWHDWTVWPNGMQQRRGLGSLNGQETRNGRSERIRTSDPLLPKQVRYQAALRSDRCRLHQTSLHREERQDGASERVRDGLSVGPKCGRERFIAIRPLGRKRYEGRVFQRHDVPGRTGALLADRSASMVRAARCPHRRFWGVAKW